MCRPFKRSPARARKHPVPFTGNPIDIQNSAPQSNVKFSKLRFGTLGSTYPGGNQRMIMMTVIIMMKIILIKMIVILLLTILIMTMKIIIMIIL